MAPSNPHFPTFERLFHLAIQPVRSAAVQRVLRAERLLLRAGLYLLLFASGTHYALERYIIAHSPLSAAPSLSLGGVARPIAVDDGTIAGAALHLTSYFFSPDQALVIAVLCLIGLAASVERRGDGTARVPALVSAPAPSEAPPAAAPAPRHPLDPDPEDPPGQVPPWMQKHLPPR
ncbi:MAG: hypothetical protein IRY99_00820 [Isosphaeraceae bacterium]|nr:hypothetical protein [Isosphaeraceae bacterium]